MISDCYSNLSQVLDESWRLMKLGVTDRRHGFHNPVVATIGLDGRPRARTVILRGADSENGNIIFHTDLRSDKVTELKNNPHISMHFYDTASKTQIRIEGIANLHVQNDYAKKRWNESQRMSRMCYSVQPSPGTEIVLSNSYSMTDATTVLPQEQEDYFNNFTVVDIKINTLEWLFLAFKGHKRARFGWLDNNLNKQSWLVP